MERKRAREAEEWRLKQLRSGVSSQQNSNFQVSQLSNMALPPLWPAHLPSGSGLSNNCNYCALAVICGMVKKVEYEECGR